jgi:hypothetical protein
MASAGVIHDIVSEVPVPAGQKEEKEDVWA